jgi:NADH-quinone oxidoreductase subunit N
VTSVVGAYYYLRIVKIMYFDEPAGAFDPPASREVQVVMLATALIILFFTILPAPLINGADAATASLFAG